MTHTIPFAYIWRQKTTIWPSGAFFLVFAWNSVYFGRFWKKRCCLPTTFLLQMIKNCQDERKPTKLLQVTGMPELINWKQVDWHGVWMGCEPSNCNLSYHLTVIRTLKKTTKTIQNWGTGKNAFLYREETLLSREETPLYISSKRHHQNCYTTKAHQQALVSAQSCCGSMFALKKTVWWRPHVFPPKTSEGFGCPCTMGQCSKRTMDVDDKKMRKWQKRFESRIEDKWGRKAVLTRKAEISR